MATNIAINGVVSADRTRSTKGAESALLGRCANGLFDAESSARAEQLRSTNTNARAAREHLDCAAMDHERGADLTEVQPIGWVP